MIDFRRAIATLTFAAAVVLAVSGCTEPSVAEPSALPSATADAPIFASDEEALAAAEAALVAYKAMADQILEESNGIDRIREFVTPEYYDEIFDSMSGSISDGRETIGSSTYRITRLTDTYESDRIAIVVVYACLDISNVRVLDGTGTDITDPEATKVFPFQLTFESELPGSQALVLDGGDVWVGTNFC